MKKHTIRNLLSFFLVLVLTVVTVAALSVATNAQADPVLAIHQQNAASVEDTATRSLSAVPSASNNDVLVSVIAFALLISIPVAGLTVYRRARRKGKMTPDEMTGRKYSPRADMSFRGTVKHRV